MKRIFLGLIALGLAFGLMLGCQLNGPADAVDQTQVDSFLASFTDGAFNEELSETLTIGSVVDGWEYDQDGDAGQSVIYTLTFGTDGSWEYKSESYEAAAKTDAGNAASPQGVQDVDGDATTGEAAYVQGTGFRGTYSYDADTMMFTITYGGDFWETGATPAYEGAWNTTTNTLAVTNQLEAGRNIVFTKFGTDLIGATDLTNLIAAAPDEDDICAKLLALFTEADEARNYVDDGVYMDMTKNFRAGATLAAPNYLVVEDAYEIAITDTEITYWNKEESNQINTGVDVYSETAGSTELQVWTVDFDNVLADGWACDIENAWMTKQTPETIVAATGAYTAGTVITYEVEPTSTTATTIIGVVNNVQMAGDGYVVW